MLKNILLVVILTNNVFIMYNLLYYCTHPKILATSQKILFYFIAICLKKTISRLLLKKLYDSVKKLQKISFTVKKTCHAKKIAKIVIKSKPYV